MDTRRQFLKKGLYLAPVVMTVAVRPSFATSCYKPKDCGNGNGGGQPDKLGRRWRARERHR